jgi:hypothetical protein
MELYDQMRKISFVFFVVLGIAHFWAGLFFVNGYGLPYSDIVNRVSFIPFVITAGIYVFSHLKCRLIEFNKDAKWVNYAAAGLGAAVFIGLLAIELLMVDSSCPLIYC